MFGCSFFKKEQPSVIWQIKEEIKKGRLEKNF
jgi:hypothetical protein